MPRSTTSPVRLGVVAALAGLALAAGTAPARAASGCGIVAAAGHTWIVVAKGVPCATAKRVTRALAARTSRVRTGQRVVTTSPLLRGFTCVLASQGKPGGSCATAGAARSVLWIRA